MTSYAPQAGAFVSRPPCANCGAAAALHVRSSAEWRSSAPKPCPERSRPDSLEGASSALRSALAGGDAARVFAARGDLQRVMDHRPGTCLPLCEACDLLLATAS